uniref:Peroxisome proliferator-activated receptor gamma coactivator 1-alpha n=1 Tax=Diabrotica virgifera virgifera TaxID=50390 RepID=A0A6P7F0K3_DIAVI
MDVDLLRDGEQFSTFDSSSFLDPYPDEGTTLDSIHSLTPNGYEWTLEGEQEINGDIALIPVCDMNLTNINDTAPSIDDFHKIMSDWQQFINVDASTDFAIEEPILNTKDVPQPCTETEDLLNTSNFDITEYLNDVDPIPQAPVSTNSANVSPTSSSESCTSNTNASSRKFKAGMKKMDLQAQRYIIEEDDDDVDVETISECEENTPVLEAKDLTTLLEQFEATQIPHFPDNFVSESIPSHIFEEEEATPVNIKQVVKKEEALVVKQEAIDDDYTYGYGRRKGSDKKNRKIDKRKKDDSASNLKEQAPAVSKKEPQLPLIVKKEPVSPIAIKKEPQSPLVIKKELVSPVVVVAKKEPVPPVIVKKELPSPIPNKSTPKPVNTKNVTTSTSKPQSVDPPSLKPDEYIQKLPKAPEKPLQPSKKPLETPQKVSDSRQKPSVCSESTTSNTPNKQILDYLPQELIERIKESGKRKPISVIPPIPTKKRGCPRMQEACAQLSRNKMIKLVGDVHLDHNYCSMNMVESYPKNPKKDSGFESAEEEERTVIGNQPTVKTADGKLMVSLLKVRRKNLDPLAPVERLDEIKPLLQKASDMINGNSLITSVIENIPKVIDSCDPKHIAPENKDRLEHGEDKTIVYLPKNRVCQETQSVECQTNISLIQQTKASRYRRRRVSSSSSESSDSSQGSRRSRSPARRQKRNRSSGTSRCSSSSKSSRSSNSNSSTCSTYSSRSSSRSRSRSRSSSPRYSRREKERLKEIEERRVIYVGRVAKGSTKEDLKMRFQRFGPITNISLHSRDHSYFDNYGFVTFANKLDAYEAIEHGNDDPWQPKYDLSFGGRRIFCQTTYSDLDNMRDESGYFIQRGGPTDDSFDQLLRDVQDRIRKRKA